SPRRPSFCGFELGRKSGLRSQCGPSYSPAWSLMISAKRALVRQHNTIFAHIRRSPNRWETIQVSTEEDAIRKIREIYPDAVSGPWEADYDYAVQAGPPVGQVKLVYETQSAPSRKSHPI